MPVPRPPRVTGRGRGTDAAGRCSSARRSGSGHVRRDLAIADELRALHPDLQIDWLTQQPVTRVLEERGEHVHPASAFLAGETAHIESEAGEHDLQRVPGGAGDGRDPRRQLHGLRRPRRGRALRPVGRRRGLGRRRVPARQPRAQAGAVRVAHRLHRLVAMRRERTTTRPRSPPSGTPSGSSVVAGTRGCATARCSWGRRPTWSTSRSARGCPPSREWARERYAFAGYVLGAALARSGGGPRGARLPAGRAGLPGHGRRLRRRAAPLLRRTADAFGLAEKRVPGLRMVLVDRAPHRPGLGPRSAGRGGARLPAGAAAAPRRLRPRRRPGRPVDDDGADRGPASLRVRAAPAPLRAAGARAAPARSGTGPGAGWTTRRPPIPSGWRR